MIQKDILSIINDPNSAGIYIHIPFCKKACNYCNFHFSTLQKYKQDVLNAMQIELQIQKNYLGNRPIETIYLGGGTPSLLTYHEIDSLLNTIYKTYNVSDIRECTIEMNPDDINKDYLKLLSRLPVNRLSIGVQSFHDSDLIFMNRSHNAQQAEYAIKTAQDAGFNNLSIDLIYGIPQSTNPEWEQNIATLLSFNVPHFSAYSLTVENKTALYYDIKKRKTKDINQDQSAQQFEILMNMVENNGYEQYEISNYCTPGRYAIHNTNYWLGKQYLGIGPSAHSYNGDTRKWNISNNALYSRNLLQHQQLLYEEEILNKTQQVNEYIMTSIRTKWGCDLGHIAEKWGSDLSEMIKKNSIRFIENETLRLVNNVLILTNKGKLFADNITSELFFDNSEMQETL